MRKQMFKNMTKQMQTEMTSKCKHNDKQMKNDDKTNVKRMRNQIFKNMTKQM